MAVPICCLACGAKILIPERVFEARLAGKLSRVKCNICDEWIEVDATTRPTIPVRMPFTQPEAEKSNPNQVEAQATHGSESESTRPAQVQSDETRTSTSAEQDETDTEDTESTRPTTEITRSGVGFVTAPERSECETLTPAVDPSRDVQAPELQHSELSTRTDGEETSKPEPAHAEPEPAHAEAPPHSMSEAPLLADKEPVVTESEPTENVPEPISAKPYDEASSAPTLTPPATRERDGGRSYSRGTLEAVEIPALASPETESSEAGFSVADDRAAAEVDRERDGYAVQEPSRPSDPTLLSRRTRARRVAQLTLLVVATIGGGAALSAVSAKRRAQTSVQDTAAASRSPRTETDAIDQTTAHAAASPAMTAAIPAPPQQAQAAASLPDTKPPALETKPQTEAKPEAQEKTEAESQPEEPPYNVRALEGAFKFAFRRANDCHEHGGPGGTAKLFLTFAPTGKVTAARLDGEPIASSSVGRCILMHGMSVYIPPFKGEPFTTSREFTLR